jgi:hypothetical protein
VDGSHLFENVFVDAFYCARLLNGGGLIAFDDSTDPHVAKTMGFLRNNFMDALKEILPEDARSNIARLLGKRQLTIFERKPYTGPHQKYDTPLREWDSRLGRF